MILFEIPAYADIQRFCARIRPRWSVWQMFADEVWLIGARVRVDDVDLAVLLREVEAAISELDLQAIRYCLDGRFYVMEGLRTDIEERVELALPDGRVADQR